MSDLFGSKLLADFGNDGVFGGIITNYCKKRGHHVVYEDGDDEWIKDILVRSYMHDYKL